jgi:hypothetical protein|tara:strand:- start:340 stop:969 length:630 start_codon:yes stop_codon:yes gene_type:complete
MDRDIVYLDLETITGDWVEKPAPEYSGFQSVQTLNEQEARDEYDALQLKPGMARIICIGTAWNDQEAECVMMEEKFLIDQFIIDWHDNHTNDILPLIVGHNVIKFDLQKLYEACIKHKHYKFAQFIRVNYIIFARENTYDLMTKFAGDRGYISQHNLCRYLGTESSKDNLSGVEIAQAWRDSRREDIKAYQIDDVNTLRLNYREMTGGE